jgi:hypothetical protein
MCHARVRYYRQKRSGNFPHLSGRLRLAESFPHIAERRKVFRTLRKSGKLSAPCGKAETFPLDLDASTMMKRTASLSSQMASINTILLCSNKLFMVDLMVQLLFLS